MLLRQRGVRRHVTARQRRHHLADQPRLAIGTAPDHHAVRTALQQRRLGILDRADVAIDDHRQLHRVLNAAHEGPIGGAAVELAAGAAVHGYQVHAFAFGNARQFRRVQAVVIPAHPHLERDGQFHRLHRGANKLRRQRQIAHQRRSGVAVDHLLHRAAHVDVDDRRALLLVELGGFGHAFRLATGQLHGDGLLARVPGGFLDALPRLADHCFRCNHLGHGQAGAEPLDERPERHVGHAGHRCQDHGHIDAVGTDLDGGDKAHCARPIAQIGPFRQGERAICGNPCGSTPSSLRPVPASEPVAACRNNIALWPGNRCYATRSSGCWGTPPSPV